MIKNKNNLTRLEIIRKSKKYSRDRLAKASGMSLPYIQKLEDGKLSFDNMKISSMLKLAKELKVKPTEILPLELSQKIK